MTNRNIFTVYDMMEARGVFENNPANVGAKTKDGQPTYKGPQQYPKMLYHPQGKTRVLVPGMTEITPYGPVLCGRIDEIIHQVVEDEIAERKFRNEGWHVHPAHAMAARGDTDVPAISADTRIQDLEAKIAALEAEKQNTLDLSAPLKPMIHPRSVNQQKVG